MFQQMSVKNLFSNCFKSTFWTFMQFTSNRRDKLWMFQQMSIKNTFYSCFKTTFCTLMQFSSNR
ncbi:unnamed protein product [Callosobruchus maculatus]|uniref:Uncharacterized protein n=1 Tax=Callosobruchus maculatus TaxID=64391 RepID=A0A653D3X8_CALMS|nr:unnamed protein product [Callosobruchus maculatus]VEN54882.1 unnamed protein product [Callosobruchus maculatus]